MGKMLNVRVDEDLAAAIDEAADEMGVSRSVWMREALAACLNGTVTKAHPERALILQGVDAGEVRAKGCKHPPTAHREYPFRTVCTLCGTVVKRRG